MMEKRDNTYVLAWAATIAFTVIPFLFAENSKEYATYFMPFVAIIILIIIDQYKSYNSILSIKSYIDNGFGNAVAKNGVVTVLSLKNAHLYVAGNACRANRIYNTRLAHFSSEMRNQPYIEMRKKQDDGILSAIECGVEYFLVYDESQSEQIDDFNRRYNEIKKNKNCGSAELYRGNFSSLPLLQFIVLEYTDHKECLIGYGFGTGIVNTRNIYLIRNDAFAEYLVNIYNGLSRGIQLDAEPC